MLKNSFFSIVQMVFATLFQFILYRVIFKEVGVEKLGVWAIVLTLNTFMNYASLGLPGGVVKFVAKYLARNDLQSCSELTQTAIISMSFLSLIGLIIAYPIFRICLPSFVGEELELGIKLLNLSVISFLIFMIYNTYVSVFDGFNQIYRRNIQSIIINSISFGLSIMFIRSFGIIGLVYAKIIENLLYLFTSIIVIRQFFPQLPIIPFQFRKKFLKEILNYSLNFQLMAIGASLIDPMVKAILSLHSGLALVGYYEMAQKLVNQLRCIISLAFQSLFPIIANLQETAPYRIRIIYLRAFRLILLIIIPAFSLLCILAPLISFVWLGSIDLTFIKLLILLSLGYGVGILNIPALLTNFGSGNLKWNQISNFIALSLTPILSLGIGNYYGSTGVVIGVCLAMIISNNIVTIHFHVKNRIKKDDIMTISSCVVLPLSLMNIIGCSWVITQPFKNITFIATAITMGLIYTIMTGIISYRDSLNQIT